MSVNNYPGKNAYFNGNNIAGIAGIFIKTIDVYQSAKRVAESYKLARSDGENLIADPFDTKPITVVGQFACNSQAQLEAARDTLMGYLNAFNAVFYTDVNGLARQWQKCYVADVSFSEFAGGYATVTISIMANDPFGYDTSYQTLVNNVNYTTQPQTLSFTPGGTAPDQDLLTTVVINTFTGSLATFPLTKLTNNTSGDSALFTGAAVAGDILIFDSKTGVLTQNGTAVAFDGVIPKASPGLSGIVYSDSCSARNVNITVQNLKKYL